MHAKILVVEDDPDIMRIIMNMLRAAGFEPIAAYGGEDALHKLAAQRIDLVVTDLAMPQMTGAELVHEIKTNPATAAIPVVVVTAYTWEPIAQAALQAGSDALITKPFTSKQLIQAIRKQIG